MIQLSYIDTAFLNDDDVFLKHLDRMSEYRKKKTESLKLRSDKNLSLGAGILMSNFLSEIGKSEKKMKYSHTANGKPVFCDLPGVYFNISHSGTVALAAFSDCEIGCDIEEIGQAKLDLAKRFFCSEEYDLLLMEADPEKRNLLFFRIWTLKESFIKALGYGMKLPLNSFLLHFGEGEKKSEVIAEIKPEAAKIIGIRKINRIADKKKDLAFNEVLEFNEYFDIPGFCAACCSKGRHPAPALCRIDPNQL